MRPLLGGDRCHHINGSCLRGCSHGYRGNYCNDSLFFIWSFLSLLMISWKLLISFFSVHINIISYHSKLNVENLICINYISAACPSGRFGLDCINRCDTYCSGSKSCDPVIGICSEGCKQGYSGLMCGLGKVTNYALNLIKIVINLLSIWEILNF